MQFIFFVIKVLLLVSNCLSRRGGHNWEIFVITLFHVLEHLDQFKAIKENLLRRVGHQDPLLTPPPLRLSQKPKFVVFFFLKDPLNKLIGLPKFLVYLFLHLPNYYQTNLAVTFKQLTSF